MEMNEEYIDNVKQLIELKDADKALYEEKKKRRKTVCRNVNFENS